LTRIAFVFEDSSASAWTGGVSYYENLLTGIRLADNPKKHTLLGLIPNACNEFNDLLQHFDEVEQLSSTNNVFEKIMNRTATLLTDHPNLRWLTPEPGLSRASRRAGAEVVFLKRDPSANFRIPVVCWFPDFQYLNMPEMFDVREAENYNQAVRNIARYATRVLLSSHATQKDFDHLLPEYKDKVQVIPFAAWIPDNIQSEDPGDILKEYHLPEKFYYLPNQFWKHKNHGMVLNALEISLRFDPNITVAASGSLSDFRNPAYPSEFTAEIARRGLRENFILQGLIPRKHVYALMRQSLAILQPSLFEGWSTSVEEAKSLGKQIILSDLEVHREQNAPGAIYFDPHAPEELAELLLKGQREMMPGIDPLTEQQARESMLTRVRDFGASFLALMSQAACK
jgi:hypothetical protein